METFVKDLKHSLRMFRKSPSFTLTALAALAFGIGANTAIFSVVNAVLFKPLPFPDADRIVLFMNTFKDGSGPGASPAKFVHWKQQTEVVQDVAVFRTNVVNFTGSDVPQQLLAGQVSADLPPPNTPLTGHPRMTNTLPRSGSFTPAATCDLRNASTDPAAAILRPASVHIRRGSGMIPTRSRSSRSASQHVATVGSSWLTPSVCQTHA